MVERDGMYMVKYFNGNVVVYRKLSSVVVSILWDERYFKADQFRDTIQVYAGI